MIQAHNILWSIAQGSMLSHGNFLSGSQQKTLTQQNLEHQLLSAVNGMNLCAVTAGLNKPQLHCWCLILQILLSLGIIIITLLLVLAHSFTLQLVLKR